MRAAGKDGRRAFCCRLAGERPKKNSRFKLLIPQVVLGRPVKGTLLNPTCGSLKGDLIERV